jgi:glycosyltransferase involved in cell wall biosynthesis
VALKAPDLQNRSFFPEFLFLCKYAWLTFKEISKIHRHKRVDLIHAHSPFITGLIAWMCSKIYRIPYLYTYHGLDFSYKIQYYIDLNLIGKNAQIVCSISSKIINYFMKYQIFNPKKLHLVKNGIIPLSELPAQNLNSKQQYLHELGLKEIKANDKVIIYVGYMTIQQKVNGMKDFLKAFSKFTKDLGTHQGIKEQFHLIYIGDGPLRKQLQNMKQKSHFSQNIHLVGKKNTQDLAKFYSLADLSVLTSYIEGFPNVILEALKYGVPVLATAVGEIPTILSENVGFLVHPGNWKEMIKKLRLYFRNIKLQQTMKQNAFNLVKEKYSWKDEAKKYRKIYSQIIQDNEIKITNPK